MSEILGLGSVRSGSLRDGNNGIIGCSINKNFSIFPYYFFKTRRLEVGILPHLLICKKAPVVTRVRVSKKITAGMKLHLYCLYLVQPNTSWPKPKKANLKTPSILAYNRNVLVTLPIWSFCSGVWSSTIFCSPLSFLNWSTNIIMLFPDL